jgi:hypothetical protein
MAWRYCRKCEGAMDRPTIREIIAGEQQCGCGWTHHIEQHERESAAEDLLERLERIEKILTVTRLGGYPNEPA